MQRRTLFGLGYVIKCFVVLFALFYFTPPAHAAQTVPYQLNFQGRLTDGTGATMPDGLYNMKFRIMSALTGGSTIWSETRDTTNRVQVTNGIFSIQLGSVTALTPTTQYPLYLEVELPTPATATCSGSGCAVWTEGPMTPRSMIGSAPYAMNADMLDGIDGASFAQLSASQTFTGTNTFTGTFAYQPASDSTTAFQIKNNGGSALLVADTTNLNLKVGGGDVSPDGNPALLVLDYKNTSSDPTGVDGAIYYNSSKGKFRCQEASVWKDCISAVRARYEMHDDFMFGNNFSFSDGAIAADGALGERLAWGGSFTRQAGTLNHPGILRFSLGTNFFGSPTAALTSSLDTTNQVLFGGGIWVSNIMTRVVNLSTSTDPYTAYNGFLDGTSTSGMSPNNGCYIKYTAPTTPTTWVGACRNAGTESSCILTGNVVANDWYNLTTTVNAAATSVTFVANDITASTTSTCTVTTNIPTSNAVSMTIGFARPTNSGSNTVSIDYDYAEYIAEGLSR